MSLPQKACLKQKVNSYDNWMFAYRYTFDWYANKTMTEFTAFDKRRRRRKGVDLHKLVFWMSLMSIIVKWWIRKKIPFINACAALQMTLKNSFFNLPHTRKNILVRRFCLSHTNPIFSISNPHFFFRLNEFMWPQRAAKDLRNFSLSISLHIDFSSSITRENRSETFFH